MSADEQRRELILNILLSGLAGVGILADITVVNNRIHGNNPEQASSIVIVLFFSALIAGLWWLSRKGRHNVSAYVLLGIFLLGATNMLLAYSFVLPATQVALAIFVVVCGVLLTARAALNVTFVLVAYVLVVGYAQVYGHLHPDTKWLNQKLEMGDCVGLVAGLLVIGLVSWLANRETDRSLDRARRSEAALEIERDQLEVKVVERTRELERAQMERVMELQRLAEFGRMSAGLLHDVASPLTVASLNLKQIDEMSDKADSLLLKRALQSLHYIERFLDSARKQLKSQGNVSSFVVSTEIKQVLSILKHRAREAEVNVELRTAGRFQLVGDPVKFNQIIANLILNAIEAYDDTSPGKKKRVFIDLNKDGKWLKITVTDHGRGLTSAQIERVFDTFYSTRLSGQSNMGIGLATVKKLVEADFGGRVNAKSSPRLGTRFTVYLCNQKAD